MEQIENIEDRYVIQYEVGSGSQGDLFAAREIDTDRKVAIKIQKEREFESTNHFEELANDLTCEGNRTQKLIKIPGVPKIIASGHYRDRNCIILEFVEGCLLYDLMVSARPFRLSAITSIIGQLCETLDAVHSEGFVHRDLKPENVMVQPDGRIRLIDLGLATTTGQASDGGCGTLGYAPPEQLDANRDGVTAQADIFSLGCMLLEMAVMRLPYSGAGRRPAPDCPVLPPDRLAAVPTEIAPIALRMVEREPEHRPGDVREVFANLRLHLPILGSHPPVKPLRPDPTEFYRTHLPSL